VEIVGIKTGFPRDPQGIQAMLFCDFGQGGIYISQDTFNLITG
jgi:hypothetical protein